MTWAWLRHPIMAVLAILVFVLCFGNFFWFASEYGRLGGGASSGMVQDGRYFVGNQGDYHEVTCEDWEWSRSHAASLVISHPLAMLAMTYLLFGWIFPLAIGRARPDTAARVAQVRATGPPVASGYIGARLGSLNFRGPLLRVSVHPGGVVFQPMLMPSRAILTSELVAVEVQPPRYGGLQSARVVLHHTAPDVRKTVILYASGQLMAALCSLRPG